MSNTIDESCRRGCSPRLSDILRGILLMCAGVSMFPFMNAAVKLLAAHYPATQITWARFTGHLIFMLVVFLPQHRWTLLRTRRPGVQGQLDEDPRSRLIDDPEPVGDHGTVLQLDAGRQPAAPVGPA